MKLFSTTTTVFDVLRRDHEAVQRTMDDMFDAETDAARSHAFAELKAMMTAHMDAEEAAFYPRLRYEDETRALVLAADVERRLLRQMLDELEKSEIDDAWMAKLHMTKDMVAHHAQREERRLFPIARRVIDKGEAENLAAVVEEEKHLRSGDYVGV